MLTLFGVESSIRSLPLPVPYFSTHCGSYLDPFGSVFNDSLRSEEGHFAFVSN
jgi:hypothetical protein